MGTGAGPDSRVVGVVVGGFVLGPWSRPGPGKKNKKKHNKVNTHKNKINIKTKRTKINTYKK